MLYHPVLGDKACLDKDISMTCTLNTNSLRNNSKKEIVVFLFNSKKKSSFLKEIIVLRPNFK